MLSNLLNKKSYERKDGKPFNRLKIVEYLKDLTNTWKVIEDKKISHSFVFKTFKEAISFVNKVADLAESENHHPNIHILFNRVKIVLTTHSVGGLSENDFIVAEKIERIT